MCVQCVYGGLHKELSLTGALGSLWLFVFVNFFAPFELPLYVKLLFRLISFTESNTLVTKSKFQYQNGATSARKYT